MNENAKEEEFKDVKGFLKKCKTSSFSKIFGKTNIRYFEINFKKKIFGYKLNQSDRLFKTAHKFSDVVDFSTNLQQNELELCDWKFGFKLKTESKDYLLFTQTNSNLLEWEYAMKIILKRVPEAFPKISDLVFQTALNIFFYPYVKEQYLLEEKKKRKIEERQRKLRQEEERIKKQKEDAEKEKAKEMERKREAEDDLKRKLIEEEKRLRLLETENGNSKKIGKHKLIYDEEFLETFLEEVDKPEEVNKPFKLESVTPGTKDNKKSSQNLLIKDTDINDWNYYDESNHVINGENLINFNPILMKQNKRLGVAFHSVIKGYVDPNVPKTKLHLENPHIPANTKDCGGKIPEISEEVNLNKSLNNDRNNNINKTLSDLNKKLSIFKNSDLNENIQNLGKISEANLKNSDREFTISKKATLLESIMQKKRKDKELKRNSSIDIDIVNKDEKGYEINLKIKDVNIQNKNRKDNVSFYDKYINKKKTEYKNHSRSLIIDSKDEIENKISSNENPNSELNDKKKKMFEKIFFHDKKIEDIEESLNKNNLEGKKQKNKYKKIIQPNEKQIIHPNRLTLADINAFNNELNSQIIEKELLDFDIDEENLTNYLKNHKIKETHNQFESKSDYSKEKFNSQNQNEKLLKGNMNIKKNDIDSFKLNIEDEDFFD